MDRSKVRISLISVGIIAGLTLILYLPVLIWSPPWGEDGYYPMDESVARYYILSGDTLTVHANWKKEILHIPVKIIPHPSEPDSWALEHKPGSSYFNFSNNTMKSRGSTGEINKFNKCFNPLTLWHIKWLEWTAD